MRMLALALAIGERLLEVLKGAGFFFVHIIE